MNMENLPIELHELEKKTILTSGDIRRIAELKVEIVRRAISEALSKEHDTRESRE